jgi:hypothetical protein
MTTWPSGDRDTTEWPKVSVDIAATFRPHLENFISIDGVEWSDYDGMDSLSGHEQTPQRWRSYRKMYERLGLIRKSGGQMVLTTFGKDVASIEEKVRVQKDSILENFANRAVNTLLRYQFKNPSDDSPDFRALPDDCDMRPYYAIWKCMHYLDGKLHFEELNRVLLKVLHLKEVDVAIEKIKSARAACKGDYSDDKTHNYDSLLGTQVFTDQPSARMGSWFSLAGWGGLIIENSADSDGFRNLTPAGKKAVERVLSEKLPQFTGASIDDWYNYYAAPELSHYSVPSGTKSTVKGGNTIFFGPPGTGKSTLVANRVGSSPMFRTQFHPEYSNSDFIGSYRPVVGFESDSANVVLGFDGTVVKRPVNYFSFVPGPLAQAIACALNTEEHVFLVIEEINRGDCAAIFGDVFQLLDRNSEGGSEFGITPTPELLSYLKHNAEKVSSDGKLYLPANLSLLATMNTCDQSLYPMDSAFKRRWHWVACPIDFGAVLSYTTGIRPFLDDEKAKWDWIKLVESINKNIVRDRMEDKQIGPWFIKPESSGSVSWEGFLNKCLFYLWHDVFKDEQFSDFSPFRNDCPEVFSEMQQKMRVEGLAAVLKAELLEHVAAA